MQFEYKIISTLHQNYDLGHVDFNWSNFHMLLLLVVCIIMCNINVEFNITRW